MLVVPLVAVALSSRAANASPDDVVADYYDHLDFRRWRSAYELLDPLTRPDYELWRLQISVEGGLIASYSSLDELTTQSTLLDDDRVHVDVDLRYLTSLDFYSLSRDHELVRRDGRGT